MEISGFLADTPIGGATDGVAEIKLLFGLNRFESFVIDLDGYGFSEGEVATCFEIDLRRNRAVSYLFLQISIFIGFGKSLGLPCTTVEWNAHNEFVSGDGLSCIFVDGFAPVEGGDRSGRTGTIVFIICHDDDAVGNAADEGVVVGIAWMFLFMCCPAGHDGDTEDFIFWKSFL